MKAMFQSIGLLWLRVSLGTMMLVGHGLDKLLNFAEKSKGFPDPIGVGSFMSLSLATFAEFGCAVLLILGLATRFSTIPLIVTMAVAGFVFHANDGWKAQELAMLYLAGFITLLVAGGGAFSLDSWFWSWWRKRASKRRAD